MNTDIFDALAILKILSARADSPEAESVRIGLLRSLMGLEQVQV